jgi:hypothetical protein
MSRLSYIRQQNVNEHRGDLFTNGYRDSYYCEENGSLGYKLGSGQYKIYSQGSKCGSNEFYSENDLYNNIINNITLPPELDDIYFYVGIKHDPTRLVVKKTKCSNSRVDTLRYAARNVFPNKKTASLALKLIDHTNKEFILKMKKYCK